MLGLNKIISIVFGEKMKSSKFEKNNDDYNNNIIDVYCGKFKIYLLFMYTWGFKILNNCINIDVYLFISISLVLYCIKILN